MEEFLKNVIRDISRQREEKGIKPTAVLMSEIQNAMAGETKAILNRLCKEGVMTFHRTLNDVSFEIKEKQL